MPEQVASVATAFARAQDEGDLATVARLLAPGCDCRDGATRVEGPEGFVALHRDARRWLEREFDEIRHHSSVAPVPPDRATIEVTTTLMRMPARWHRLRHTFELVVRDGLVASIAHVCEPAAASEFRAFVAGLGGAPVPPGLGV